MSPSDKPPAFALVVPVFDRLKRIRPIARRGFLAVAATAAGTAPPELLLTLSQVVSDHTHVIARQLLAAPLLTDHTLRACRWVPWAVLAAIALKWIAAGGMEATRWM